MLQVSIVFVSSPLSGLAFRLLADLDEENPQRSSRGCNFSVFEASSAGLLQSANPYVYWASGDEAALNLSFVKALFLVLHGLLQ